MADKKVLILYASAGHGHEKAARAVESALAAHPGHSVRCVDVLHHTALGFGANYRRSYLFMIRALPWVWGAGYYLTDIPTVYFFVRPLRRIVNHFLAGGVEKLIETSGADVVVSTHFMGTETASFLKRQDKVRARLVTVVTDYLAHSFWLTAQTDLYCVASEETRADLLRRGVPSQKVLVTGIPIEAKFSTAHPREAARASLGFQKNRFTVLLTSGGAGIGLLEPLSSRLAILEPPLQIIVVCGTNEAMRVRLKASHGDRPNFRVMGFVDNIQELMAACDLVVGKGGGLTVTESLAMARPMVMIGAVPGQETRNVRVALKRKAAVSARSLSEVIRYVQRFQKDTAFYEQTVHAIDGMRRPKAAAMIAEAL